MDTSALTQFHAALKPIMDAIPAVLEMVEQKADIDRAMAAYAANAQQAKDSVQNIIEAANQQIATLNADINSLQSAKVAAIAEMEQAHISATSARAAAVDAANQAKYVADAAIVQHNARVNEAEMAAKARTAEVEDAATARAAELEKSIADLTAKEASAQAALDKLRAKLG